MLVTRVVVSALLLISASLPAAETRPNILVIVSDDQGWADAGFQGSREVPTPHLDALAASGVRCTSGYVTHAFCSPTRAGLLVGRYQQRFGHENNPYFDPENARLGLPLGERLLPQHLQQAGWTTGWVGKWHLGATPEHAPWNRGFVETFGFIGGGHRYLGWKPVLSGNGREYQDPIRQAGQEIAVDGHLTTRFGDEAAAFITRNAAKPWFLYLAFNAPHSPHEPTPERLARFADIADLNRRKYVAQVSLMDDAIGVALAAVAASGVRERTLVFFFSDNGGPANNASDNTPLRGHKGQLYDGGVRVPFVVSWPTRLPAGKTYDRPVSSLDAFATALAVAQVPAAGVGQIDGVDLRPFLDGTRTDDPHARLFWRVGGGEAHALREGDWKLVRKKGGVPELFDLARDRSESTDIAAANGEVVTRLVAALDAWDRELVPPAFPGLSEVKRQRAGVEAP